MEIALLIYAGFVIWLSLFIFSLAFGRVDTKRDYTDRAIGTFVIASALTSILCVFP